MSLIMNVIGPELSELFALEFAKLAESDCLYPSIFISRPISTNHSHNIYDNEILDEFNYGSNPIWSYLNEKKLFNLTLFTL